MIWYMDYLINQSYLKSYYFEKRTIYILRLQLILSSSILVVVLLTALVVVVVVAGVVVLLLDKIIDI